MQKKFVFFDLGNTLVRVKRPLLEYCVQRIAFETGKKLDSAARMEQAIMEFKKAEMAEWNVTPMEKINSVKNDEQEQEFWQNFYTTLPLRLGHRRPTRDLANLLTNIVVNPNSFELFEDVVETLEQLRKQDMKLGIISNAFPSAKRIIQNLGLERWFTYIILSFEHDLLPKPHPHIYKHAIEQTRVKPGYANSILFVDDRPHFAEGAARPGVGMSAFLIDRDCIVQEYTEHSKRGEYKKIVDLREIPEYINNTGYQLPLFASGVA